jgi:glutamate N-acetyltransferase/amino-acid N-acetyltransferase
MALLFTDLEGVYADGIHSGIKPNKNKDLCYIYMPDCFASAGVFTTNQFVAPSVSFTRRNMGKHTLKAVVVNSGNANAGTGDEGLKHVKETAKAAAEKLGLKPYEIGVASTGKIGDALPIKTLLSGLKILLENPLKKEGQNAAEAIMTTDLCPKTVYVSEKVGDKTIVVAGMTKGSGMIAPNMATTLGFLVTNAVIDHENLQKRLKAAIDKSYNMISVDNDTSTNDMMLLFSVGKAKEKVVLTEEWEAFERLLLKACTELAKMIAKDGEGATKLIEVHVKQAIKQGDARKIALAVVNSPLVKTALHGADPNWGRIIAAACKDTSIKINPQKLSLYFGDICVFAKGEKQSFSYEAAVSLLKLDTVYITLDLNLGKEEATAWGCDLTKGYVDINTQYC